MNIPLKNSQITEREKFLAFILDCYIVDIGIIKEIETDKKFVSVTHATKPQMYDEISKSYKEQSETVTKHIEALYFGGAYFRQEHELKVGDVGLLLGTLTYIEKMRDVTSSKKSEHISNYQQENLKFLPIGNNQTPTTLVKYLQEEISLVTSINNTTISLKDDVLTINTDADLNIDANGNLITTSSSGIELECVNGNTVEMVAGEVKINGTNLEVLQ